MMDHRWDPLRLAAARAGLSGGRVGETRRVTPQGFDQRVDGPGGYLLRLLGFELAAVDQPAPDGRREESGDDLGAAPTLLGRQVGQHLAHRCDPGAVALAAIRRTLAVPRWPVHQVAQERAVGFVVGEKLKGQLAEPLQRRQRVAQAKPRAQPVEEGFDQVVDRAEVRVNRGRRDAGQLGELPQAQALDVVVLQVGLGGHQNTISCEGGLRLAQWALVGPGGWQLFGFPCKISSYTCNL